ncbi:MAG: hypothetical protein R3F19_33445 [Verrucomicrobiales bacterium]
MTTLIKAVIAVMVLAIVSTPLHANRILDGKKAEKVEVRHSMLGFRDTLLFYTFKGQQAILVLSIDNKDETFPVTGKVFLFDEKTTDGALKKWINNQHSDGLFPDIPEPSSSVELPKGTCKVITHKETGATKNPGGDPSTFKNYQVKFSIGKFSVDKKFKLTEFTDSAEVHVKSK